MTEPTTKPRIPRFVKVGCIVVIGLVVVLAGGGVLLVNRVFFSFDAHRDSLGIRDDLAVEDARLRFSPGMDGALWCRFTVRVETIDEVFDRSIVDTTAFSEDDYKIDINWITDRWWDPQDHQLIGGETTLGSDIFLRVGYKDNGDGTLTVYVFWFEV